MGDRDGCMMWWGSGGVGGVGGVDFCLPPVSEWMASELFSPYFYDPIFFLIPICMMLHPLLTYLVEMRYDVCKNHEASCKILMASYDFLMAIFSFSCFIGMSYALSETGVYTRDHFANSKFAFLSYAFYWSRYVQFLDIFFLVLTRCPVSWLQYYQHVGACVVMELCCLHKVDGVWVFVLFNGFIHTIMYLYHGFAIMDWPSRGRQFLDFFQLTQIVMGICFVTPHIFDPSIASNHRMMLAYCVNYVYLMLHVVLFVNFFLKTYSGEKKLVGVSGDAKFVLGPFWLYLTGGTNLQIEHHLFPRMQFKNLPKVVGAVKELAKKRGYEYMESSLYETIRKAVLVLQDNTRRNLFRTHDLKHENTTKQHFTSDQYKVNHEMSAMVLSYQKEFTEKMKFANAKCALGATRILCKAVALSLLGVIITSSSCLSSFLVPVGVFLTCIGYCGLDVIRAESQAMRFFPSDRINRLISFALCVISWKMFPFIALFVTVFCDEAWTKYFTLPVLWMRIQMLELQSKEREDLVEKGLCGGAASLVCPELYQIANVLNGFELKKGPIVSFEAIPMYHLNRISHELKVVLSDMTQKNGLNFDELEQNSIDELNNVRTLSKFVGLLLWPVRYSFQHIFLWGKRDCIFFALAFWLCADSYFSVSVSLILSFVKVIFPQADVYNNVSLIPLCLLLPLFIAAPKASRYVRSIRKAHEALEMHENEIEPGVASPGDSETTVMKWREVSKVPSTKQILDALAPFEKKNMLYAYFFAVRDTMFCCLFFSVAYFAILPLEDVLYDYFADLASSWSISYPFFSVFFMFVYYSIIWSLWGIYFWWQGLAMGGLWVLGHDCGHCSFSDNRLVNHIFGYLFHTVLLTPYFAWQFTHMKHHKFTNHLINGDSHVPMMKSLFKVIISVQFLESYPLFISVIVLLFGWPMYLITYLSGGRKNAKNEPMNKHENKSHFSPSSQIFPETLYFYILVSTMGVVSVLLFLVYLGIVYSFMTVFKLYFIPYLIHNAWLVTYTWLHHSHEETPHFGSDIDVNNPCYSWLRGALCTIDRPYGTSFNFMIHGMGPHHLVHHLDPHIPHYNLKEASQVAKQMLGPLYRYDSRPISVVLYNIGFNCANVRSMIGVQFFIDLRGKSYQERMSDKNKCNHDER